MTTTHSTPTRTRFDAWAIEQIAGLVYRLCTITQEMTLEEIVTAHADINTGDGYTLDKSIPRSTWVTRHEGVQLADEGGR